ncbi:hypothetical protein IWZ00DRAFT_545404 [Phyllosticta capitalensis]
MNVGSQQRVHPFFTKAQRSNPSEPQTDIQTSTADREHGDEDQSHLDNANQKRNRTHPPVSKGSTNKRKNGDTGATDKVKQTSLSVFTKNESVPALENTSTGEVEDATSGLETEGNDGSRKRRRRESPMVVIPVRQTTRDDVEKRQNPDQESRIEQLQEEAGKEKESGDQISALATEDVQHFLGADVDVAPASSHEQPAKQVIQTPPASSPPLIQDSSTESVNSPRRSLRKRANDDSEHTNEKSSPPKKMLRINANGRFSSPVSTAPKHESVGEVKQRKSRKKAEKQPKQLIVRMAYTIGEETTLATKIDAILAGALREPAPTPEAPEIPKPAKPSSPKKPTHPFFTGKLASKSKEESTLDPPKSDPAPTTTHHRRESAITPGKLRAQAAIHDSSEPTSHNIKPTPKRVGIEAPWPWKGIARVEDVRVPVSESQPFHAACGHRKLKNNIFHVPQEEDLVFCLKQQLKPCLAEDLAQHPDPKYGARLPERLLTTGPEIQRRVRQQIHTISFNSAGQPSGSAHPLFKSLFNRIADTLTPFDKGTCESSSWVQKYAPKSSGEFLGSSVEVAALRQWMESLTISAVEGANGLKSDQKKGAAPKPAKRKRKKNDDMDDFIISDDELGEIDMAEAEEPGRTDMPISAQRSMIRLGSEWAAGKSKIHNLVLISGPHGVGKTAAIHAVAAELGFQVFEINSSSRRSGKDVLDKIGDMTENHIVQRKSKGPIQDAELLTNALQKDIQSGKQKSMSSFFKPKAQTQSKAKPKVKNAAESHPKKSSSQSTLGGKPKHTQKQSVILLEEVDVLFADDKNFWQTVGHLALSSKRPIIMTCTDESLVPIPDSSLHAKLRFSPAPQPVISDYMLLLAAVEGHVLEREAVSKLYEVKNYDLRSSIMELDFWCQMAVGDRKGGLEWIYPRWPPGKDVDEQGQTLRVASQGTYQAGMGWVGHDTFSEDDHVGFDRQHELLLELTDLWGFEPGSYNQASRTGPSTLQDMERLAEMSSAADVYCRVSMGDRITFDPTLPPLTEKTRSNYPEPYLLVQADPLIDFSHFDTHIAIASHLASERSSSAPQISCTTPSENPTDLILAHLHRTRTHHPLTRPSFFVFDPLAEPPANMGPTISGLISSTFDRTFSIVTTDLAPYVRSIAAYDLHLEAKRLRASNLLSAGGKGKRVRTTRAARSALEGGRRETTRRERWFADLDLTACLKTAGESWAGLGSRGRPVVTVDGESNGSSPETAPSPASTAASAE